ncbi:MAG TPA: hypothetical protein VGN83_19745 [Falsiroseomonas sp.]|jgi:hypothetical protein|nr:hypothetical protein [Falsiroseomonas sp.]
MFLQLSMQDRLLGEQRVFSERSQAVIARAAAAPPCDGLCSCCGVTPVPTELGKPVPGAATR